MHELIEAWREKAQLFRDHALEPSARAYEICARELEDALEAGEQEVLTLGVAAEMSGYSADHLGRLVREGKIPNAGRLNAPRVKRSDVPMKAGRAHRGQSSFREIVREVVGRS